MTLSARRRRLLLGLLVALVPLGFVTFFAISRSDARSASNGSGGGAAPRPPASRLVVRAEAGNWSGVVIANPAARTCRRVAFPDMDPFWFAIAGDRVVYPSYSGRGRWIWLGTIAGRVRKIRTALRGSAGPVFVGRRIGYVPYDGRRILFVGGGSLIPALPSHAVIQEVAAHGDRVAVYATWGDAVGSTYRGALFVVAGGRTTKIGDEPNPLGEAPSPVWSPDGKRIAIIRNGDIWTIRPDGSHAVRITRTSSPLQGGERSPVWSPDSRRLAYAGRGNRVFDTYAAPATGGRERRLTRTAKAPPAVPQLGTIPLAWLGNWIAVERYNALGVIPARGGHITILCRLRPAGSAGWGQASWRR